MRLQLLLALLACFCLPALADGVTYQGKLESDGQPFAGTVEMVFELYEQESGGNTVAVHGPVSVEVIDGLFQEDLDFGSGAFDGSSRYLQITIDGTSLDHRHPIRPSPMALYAFDGGGGSGDTAWEQTGDDIHYDHGNVGINTNSPQEALDIAGRLRVGDFSPEASDHVCRTPEGTLASCSGEPGNGGDAWLLGGNAGTDPAADYIGTSDETPLELRVDGQRRLRIEPGGNPQRVSPNLIAGHAANTAESEESGATISGGGTQASPNSTNGSLAVVGGGQGNQAGGNWSTISGGLLNATSGVQATVGGGVQNEASGFHPTVAGGQNNTVVHNSATVGGGKENLVNRVAGTVSGGESNTVSGGHAAVGGGENNTADAGHSIVAGGGLNLAAGTRSTIGGGWNNLANGDRATVAGGENNHAGADSSSIGGGLGNAASGTEATVAGGWSNIASAFQSTVGGGSNNLAEGARSMIPGGEGNVASGAYSFAAGRNAVAGEHGSFVWADSLDHELDFVGQNGFMARATGGVGFITGVTGNGVPTSGVSLAGGGSAWQSISDRNAKRAITRVEPGDVLEGLMQMPISEYSYKSQDGSIRHMGPMAQDFHPLFGLGEDQLRISAMNLAGIALASIQGLNAELESAVDRLTDLSAEYAELWESAARQEENTMARLDRLEAENTELREQVAANSQLAERNAELEDRLAMLEAMLLEDRQLAEKSQ